MKATAPGQLGLLTSCAGPLRLGSLAVTSLVHHAPVHGCVTAAYHLSCSLMLLHGNRSTATSRVARCAHARAPCHIQGCRHGLRHNEWECMLQVVPS